MPFFKKRNIYKRFKNLLLGVTCQLGDQTPCSQLIYGCVITERNKTDQKKLPLFYLFTVDLCAVVVVVVVIMQ